MMCKKEGGSKSITKDRYDNIKGKLKNYFIPFVGANTIATNLKPKEFEEWEYWRRQEKNWAGVGKRKKHLVNQLLVMRLLCFVRFGDGESRKDSSDHH